jgi:hypothetical protein
MHDTAAAKAQHPRKMHPTANDDDDDDDNSSSDDDSDDGGGGKKKKKKAKKSKAPLPPPPLCDMCEESPSVLHCGDCKMNLCQVNGCDDDMHETAAEKAQHRRKMQSPANDDDDDSDSSSSGSDSDSDDDDGDGVKGVPRQHNYGFHPPLSDKQYAAMLTQFHRNGGGGAPTLPGYTYTHVVE